MCEIPFTTLLAPPFNLFWADQVQVRITAKNLIGYGPAATGAGAYIFSQPDAPLNFAEDIANSNMYQTALTWEDGAINGGTEVLDFRISYSTEYGDYLVLRQGITERSYIASGITTGVTYKFKV